MTLEGKQGELQMRKLWLALIALIGLQVPHASAVPVVDFHVTGYCATCALKPVDAYFGTTVDGGGVYTIFEGIGLTVLPTGTSPTNNDNKLFYPETNVFDAQGFAAYFKGGGPTDYFVDACGALGVGFSGCAVLYPDSSALDGYIQPPMFTVTNTPTPLPAALPLFATGLGAVGLFGWRRKRKAAVRRRLIICTQEAAPRLPPQK